MTPFFEYLNIDGSPCKFRYGPEGTSGNIYPKYQAGWNFANSSWPRYAGGHIFDEWRAAISNCDLHWNANTLEWELHFMVSVSDSYNIRIVHESLPIYYEFYN